MSILQGIRRCEGDDLIKINFIIELLKLFAYVAYNRGTKIS